MSENTGSKRTITETTPSPLTSQNKQTKFKSSTEWTSSLPPPAPSFATVGNENLTPYHTPGKDYVLLNMDSNSTVLHPLPTPSARRALENNFNESSNQRQVDMANACTSAHPLVSMMTSQTVTVPPMLSASYHVPPTLAAGMSS